MIFPPFIDIKYDHRRSKQLYHQNMQADPASWATGCMSPSWVTSNNFGFLFLLGNKMNDVIYFPHRRIHVIRVISNPLPAYQVRNLLFALHADCCVAALRSYHDCFIYVEHFLWVKFSSSHL